MKIKRNTSYMYIILLWFAVLCNFEYVLGVVSVERFSHIVIIVVVVLIGSLRFLKLIVSNLLSSLESMIIARYIGHDRSFIRLWCVDQICLRFGFETIVFFFLFIFYLSRKVRDRHQVVKKKIRNFW